MGRRQAGGFDEFESERESSPGEESDNAIDPKGIAGESG